MTDPLDESIREQLRSEVPLASSSASALGGLRGRMKAARRRRNNAIMAGRAAAIVLVASLGILGASRLSQEPSPVVSAGPASTTSAPEPPSSVPATDPSATTDGTFTTSGTEGEATPSSSIDAASSSSTDAVAPSSTAAVATSSSEATTTSTTDTSTTEAPTSSTQATTSTTQAATSTTETTTSTTEASAAGGSQTIASACGSVRVSWSGSTIALDQVNPGTGFSQETKSNGPERVEVSFESDDGHCEIRVDVDGGKIDPSVSEDLEHTDEGSHDEDRDDD